MNFKPFSKTKYLWLTILITSIIAIILKSTYRQYVYTNQINDFGIADASPNFFAGLVITLLYFTQNQKMTFKKYAFFALVGLIGYEIIQGSVFKNNFFDYRDIIASIIGVGFGYFVGLRLNSFFSNDTSHLLQQ